jgi:ligand-binding sensor domain-containing protein
VGLEPERIEMRYFHVEGTFRLHITGIVLLAVLLSSALPLRAAAARVEEDWTVYGDLRYVHSIAIAPDYVYFGTGGGLARFNRLKEQWETPASTPQGLPDLHIVLIGIDPLARTVWTCTPSGIYLYDPAFESFSSVETPFSTGNAHSIGFEEESVWIIIDRTARRYGREDRTWTRGGAPPSDLIWFGAAGSVSLDDPAYSFVSPLHFRDYDLNTFPLSAAARDGDELWVGSLGYGVSRYSVLMLDREHWLLGPAGIDITALARDGGTIWMAGSGSIGLTVTSWETERGAWEDLPQPMPGEGSDLRATSLLAERRYLWLGTDQGLFAYDMDKGRWKRRLLPGRGRDAAVYGLSVRGDTLWAATEAGPAWMSIKNWGSALLPIADSTGAQVSDQATFDVAVEGGYLWFASDRGIYLYDLEEGKWRLLDNPPGLLSHDAIRIMPDPETGEILFATRHGVAVYDRDESTWVEALAPGGLTGQILAAAADRTSIWCGTRHELLRFDRGTTSWETFPTDEWLPRGTIQAISSDGDYLWCGTPAGLARFDFERPISRDWRGHDSTESDRQ